MPGLMDRKKVIVRKLPPNIPEVDVRLLVQAASAGRFSWFSFVQGKTRCARRTIKANDWAKHSVDFEQEWCNVTLEVGAD